MDNDKKIIYRFLFSTTISLIALTIAIAVLLTKNEKQFTPIHFIKNDTTLVIKDSLLKYNYYKIVIQGSNTK